MNKEKKTKISIIIPFFNEEESIEKFLKKLNKTTLTLKNYVFEYIFIDDGSTDKTLNKLISITKNEPNIRIIELSRNFGKEAALTAGIDLADSEAAILMDSDLEHPPELIEDMISLWKEGFDIVLAQREDRSDETFIKKQLANSFYKIFNKLSSTKIPPNVGDFRLMNKASIEAVRSMTERQRFMKGILSWVGFKCTTIKFKVETRKEGKTKFSLSKLWKLAIEGIISFSNIPLKIWSYLGFIAMLISFFFIIVIIFRTLFFGVITAGYPSLMVVIIFFGGLQLFSIGILGEYLGRIYLETKERPIYIIRKEY